MPPKKYKILIADDSEDDRFLLTRVLRRVESCEVIGCVEDGQLAIEYLGGSGAYADRVRYPMPEVLLLDLKMPRVNGFEVLHWLGHQNFEGLQVIVLSSSFLPEDIAKTLTMGADHYLIKGEAVQTAESIDSFLKQSRMTVRSD